ADKAFVLIEGNYFDSTTNPSLHDSTTTGAIMVPTASNQNLCQSALGRACVTNTVVTSGTLTGRKVSDAIAQMKGVAVYTPGAAKKLTSATGNFGVDALGDLADSQARAGNKTTAATSRARSKTSEANEGLDTTRIG
ncbi:hypothetical protein Gpo141_00014324, partial [Globisporangium polare]